jgi:tellurium resistance protein TerD
MPVSLSKGGNVSLTKEAGGTLSEVLVGLGWDARTTDGQPFDLDAAAFALKADGKVLSDSWFVFFNQLKSPAGEIEHKGDNLTGAGEGDDEEIVVKLSQLPADIDKVDISVTIHESDVRGQNFGQVSNAFIRVVDQSNGTELVRYDLGEDFALEAAVVFGQLYRKGSEWKFKAVGQGYNNGLKGLCLDRGVDV